MAAGPTWGMQWASVLSNEASTELATTGAAKSLAARLDGAPDLVFAFVSPHHRDDAPEIPRWIRETFAGVPVVGCTGGGIIGEGREIEDEAALSLVAARLPGVDVGVHELDDDLPSDAEAWHDTLGVMPDDAPCFVLVPDPFSFEPDACIASLDAAYPEAVVVGGLASGGRSPGSHVLYAGQSVLRGGAVLISLRGDVVIDPVIAQGCKPIGQPMLVSSSDRNIILGLDQKRPGDLLREVFAELSEDDRRLFRTSLFVGIEMRDQREYEAGDFLIRNIVGLSPEGDALAVGGRVERWQAVQLHLRDRATSAADLRRRLERQVESHPRPAGALLFSCLGRGEHLYGTAGHDSRLFTEVVGDAPLGGFFCNGEIGPVGGRTFSHGYTSAFALFRPRSRE